MGCQEKRIRNDSKQVPISILVLQVRLEIVVFVVILFQIGWVFLFSLMGAGNLAAATRLSRGRATLSTLVAFSVLGVLFMGIVTCVAMTMTAMLGRLASLAQRSTVALVRIHHLLTTQVLRLELMQVVVQKTQPRDHAQANQHRFEHVDNAT